MRPPPQNGPHVHNPSAGGFGEGVAEGVVGDGFAAGVVFGTGVGEGVFVIVAVTVMVGGVIELLASGGGPDGEVKKGKAPHPTKSRTRIINIAVKKIFLFIYQKTK